MFSNFHFPTLALSMRNFCSFKRMTRLLQFQVLDSFRQCKKEEPVSNRDMHAAPCLNRGPVTFDGRLLKFIISNL